MSGFDILVLGDANPDLVMSGETVEPAFGQAERLVDEGRLVIGGSGAIFACGAAKLGLRVAFAGVVGDDMLAGTCATSCRPTASTRPRWRCCRTA